MKKEYFYMDLKIIYGIGFLLTAFFPISFVRFDEIISSYKMAPRTRNLDAYKAEIVHLFQSKQSLDKIVRYLKRIYELKISKRTLKRRL
jgi:Clr5 domain